jgi:hypothetical protein
MQFPMSPRSASRRKDFFSPPPIRIKGAVSAAAGKGIGTRCQQVPGSGLLHAEVRYHLLVQLTHVLCDGVQGGARASPPPVARRAQ